LEGKNKDIAKRILRDNCGRMAINGSIRLKVANLMELVGKKEQKIGWMALVKIKTIILVVHGGLILIRGHVGEKLFIRKLFPQLGGRALRGFRANPKGMLVPLIF